jgi:hypothetical protein
LKQNGIYVDYLGANLPMVDFKYFISIKKPDYAFCHITSPAKGFKIDKFIDQLSTVDKDITLIVSGQLIQNFEGPVASNIQIKRTLTETLQLLNSI